MKALIFILVVAVLQVNPSDAFSLGKRDASPAVFGFPIRKTSIPLSKDALSQRRTYSSSRRLSKLRRTFAQQIKNEVDFYTAEINVGTPKPQPVTLQIDTGSHDFWMNDASGSFCKKKDSDCNDFGTYSPEDSDSFRPYDDVHFSLGYDDDTEVSGIYATDTIQIAGQTFPNVLFGVADSSTSGLGVIGLGYSKQPGESSEERLPTFSEKLVENKIIKLNAYSLWLNDRTATSGSILYGGLDMAKVDGSLTTLPVLSPDVIPVGKAELTVTLNAVSFGDIRSQFFKVLLDSGDTGCELPGDFFQPVLDSLGAEHSNDGSFVDCSVANSEKTVDFEFGSENQVFTIQIPLSQFVVNEPWKDARPATSTGTPMCAFFLTAVKGDDSIAVLGDSFLRSVYVVYDLTNNEISIGKAKYTSASNIMEIPEKGVTAMDLGQGAEPVQKPLDSGDDDTVAHDPGTNDRTSTGNDGSSNAGNDAASNAGNSGTPNAGNIGTPNPGADPTSNPGSSPTSNPGADPTPNPGTDPPSNPGTDPTFSTATDDTAPEVSFLSSDPDPSPGQEGSEEA